MRSRKQNTSQGKFNGRSLKDLVLQPKESFLNWYENYFRHQSSKFKRIISTITLLVGFGLVMVLSSSNVDSIKSTGNPFGGFGMQVLFAVGGFIVMFYFSTKSIDAIERFGKRLLALSIVGQLLTRVPGIGISSGGNANWIGYGQFRIQPSEFLKLALILFLASFLTRRMDELWDSRRAGFPAMMISSLIAGAVYIISGDLGTAAVMIVVALVLMSLAGLPWQHLVSMAAVVVGIFIISTVSSPNRLNRIMSFLDQSNSDEGAGWQSVHGIWALASGGFFGTGLGQAKLNWGWIPEVENDFIFAVIGEEWGMIGALVVLGFFFLLFFQLKGIANRSNDSYVSLVTFGVMLWITLQALINIAVVLRLLPTLGVPLPLISKGGSSLLAVMMALGIVLSFERNRQPVIQERRKRR